MISTNSRRRRRGSILPVLALLIVGLCGFTALSVEIATIAMVKVQCQNAADTSAMAGARALNGGTNSNLTGSEAIALTAAEANYALGAKTSNQIGMVNFKSTEFTYTPGTYHYNTASQTFSPAYTLQAGENYNLVMTTVKRQVQNAFFSVDAGSSNSSVTPTLVATAVAAHRPRDVAVVLDFSGSMNNESDLWNAESYLGPIQGYSNNSDPIYPTFGHYSSATAALNVVSSYTGAGSSNVTQTVNGMDPLVNSYYATSATTTPSVPAFTAALSSYATQPQGDVPVYVKNAGSGSFATNPNDIFNTTYTTSIPKNSAADAFENGSVATATQGNNNLATAGYNYLYTQKVPTAPSGANASGTLGFSGYTLGPAYYGKTFFQWPPDPRPTHDWRYLYFIDSNTGAGVTNNTTLWNSSGVWNTPSSGANGYQINYKAILNWIKNIGPNPFPSTLIAGGITYYTSIPTDIQASAYNFANANSTITDPSQRFWKEYIDYCVGTWLDPFGTVQTTYNAPPNQNFSAPTMSYGPDFVWGTVQITAKPTGTPPNGSNWPT